MLTEASDEESSKRSDEILRLETEPTRSVARLDELWMLEVGPEEPRSRMGGGMGGKGIAGGSIGVVVTGSAESADSCIRKAIRPVRWS